MTDTNERRSKVTYALIALALIEGAVIAALLASKVTLSIKPELKPVRVESPLELALEYESPEHKFEELVKANPAWIPFRSSAGPPNLGQRDLPILAKCAEWKLTNHIRILIAHGASVKEALEALEASGALQDSIELLRSLANESSKPKVQSSK